MQGGMWVKFYNGVLHVSRFARFAVAIALRLQLRLPGDLHRGAHSASPIGALDLTDDRLSCLMIVAKQGCLRACKILVNMNPNGSMLIRMKDSLGRNALMYAAFHGRRECVIELSKHIPWYLEDYQGGCSLSYAVLGHNPNLMDDMCASKEFEISSRVAHCLGNALVIAIYRKNKQCIKYMVSKLENIPTWRNSVSRGCVLHAMASHADLEIFDIMDAVFKSSPETFLCIDTDGNSPLHAALKAFNKTAIRFLLKNFDYNPNVSNLAGETVRKLAKANGILFKDEPEEDSSDEEEEEGVDEDSD